MGNFMDDMSRLGEEIGRLHMDRTSDFQNLRNETHGLLADTRTSLDAMHKERMRMAGMEKGDRARFVKELRMNVGNFLSDFGEDVRRGGRSFRRSVGETCASAGSGKCSPAPDRATRGTGKPAFGRTSAARGKNRGS